MFAFTTKMWHDNILWHRTHITQKMTVMTQSAKDRAHHKTVIAQDKTLDKKGHKILSTFYFN